MLKRNDAHSMTLANARLVLGDEVVQGHIEVSGDRISAIGSGALHSCDVDLAGDYLLPGLVDIHTDHFEKHVYPRAHVRWDYTRAAMAHDAQIIGAGITTVFDSLCVGATLDNPERREILAPMIEAMENAQDAGMLKAEHLVHLRCEITDEECPSLTAENIGRDIVRMVSVMEHLPGVRQSRDVDEYIARTRARTGESEEQVRRKINALIEHYSEIGERTRPRIIEIANDHDLPLLSHDDTEIGHVDQARDEGITVSEFPCTLEAARRARDNTMTVVAGAPNVLRGGSQSGNVAVADLLAEDLVDVLASDYVPRSLLDCTFAIANDPAFAYDLPAAVQMVSKTPAEIAGLDDRGEIAIGRRADLIRVGVHDGHPYLKSAWRCADRVL